MSFANVDTTEQTEVSPDQLRRCLTVTDLTMLGIGAIIGAGIFVLTGIASATQAGPGVILSYLLAGLACSFVALSYAELSSSFSNYCGAYGYAYAGIGKLFAWIIGWDLLLEYGMDAATVSIGWSAYMQNALHACGINLPNALTNNPFHGGIINLPAILIIFLLATVLSFSVKQSARFNNWIVFIKLAVITLFIAVGVYYFDAQNWQPFLPFGTQGIVNGAGFIFFAYIGFDAVATAAQESTNPKRDLPIGIIGSLIICTVIYVIVAAVLTGMAHYSTLNVGSPVSSVLLKLSHNIIAEVIALGAIAGLTTAILAMFFGFTRVFLAMAKDGLLPKVFAKINPKTQTPQRLIWTVAFLMACAAGFLPINEIANLVNIGTLAAFIAVCGSVIALRITQPDLARPFKTPFHPIIPVLGILLCAYLMSTLPFITWVSFTCWTVFGLVIYFSYGRHTS